MKKITIFSSLLVFGSLLSLAQAAHAGDNFQIGATQASEVKGYFQARKAVYDEMARPKEVTTEEPVMATVCQNVVNPETGITEIICTQVPVTKTVCEYVVDQNTGETTIVCNQVPVTQTVTTTVPGDTSSFHDNTASLAKAYIFKGGNTLTEKVY